MARKKSQSYNDAVRNIAEMQQLLGTLKRHMVEVMADEMDDMTAAMLGDFSDAKLRRLARLILASLAMFVALVELCGPKPQRSQEADDAPMVEGEVRSDYGGNCWGVWDAETGEKFGTLRSGMQVELFCDHDARWIPTRVGMYITDLWYFDVGKDVPDYLGNMVDGLRIRYHRAEQK